MTSPTALPPQAPKTLEDAYQLILALWEENMRLRERMAVLEARNAHLEARNTHLEELVRRNSSNSSQPPSQDGPKKPPRRRDPSGRPRGGQPGHEGHGRTLLASADVDRIEQYPPPVVCPCGGVVVGIDVVERHQQWEVPPVRPAVTEFQVLAGCCGSCGRRHRGALPPEIAGSALGPRAQAVVGLLGGEFHLSKRQIAAVCAVLLGLQVSPATVSTVEQRLSDALAVPVADAHDFVKQQPVVHADETGLPQGNADGGNPTKRRGWLWVAVSETVTVFHASLSRGQDSAKALLGEDFAGMLISDRWGSYGWISRWCRQLCWAHLLREFEKMAQRDGEPGRSGAGLLAAGREMFHFWHRVRDGTLKRSTFAVYLSGIRMRVRALLTEAATWPSPDKDQSAVAKTARTCRDLLKMEAAFWLFARRADVEPTNNTAERALRSYVLWRKCSNGTQSQRGSIFVARVMTAAATCRQQGRNLLDYLTAALTARHQGLTPPSLLPAHAADSLPALA